MAWFDEFGTEWAGRPGEFGPERRSNEQVVVTVPNIVNGKNDDCRPRERGQEVSLEAAADYLEMRWRKFAEFGFPAYWDQTGIVPRGIGRSLGWAGVSLAKDTPPTVIGQVPVDGMYQLTIGCACKTADAGATSLTFTLSYYDVIAGLQTLTGTRVLTAAGSIVEGPSVFNLLGGTVVQISAVLTGTYGAATYDLFGSALKLA